jgi:trigger factor
LKTEVERLAEGRVALTVEVDPPQVEAALQDAYRRLVRTVSLPGFRPGKAPRSIVERLLGRERLWRDAVDPLVQRSFDAAAEAQGLQPVESPQVDFEKLPDAGEPFTFKAVFTAKPDVELGDYRAIRVPREQAPVTDEDVEHALEDLRQSRARWIPAEDEPAAEGMLVTVDVTGTVDGLPVPAENGISGVLGEGSLRPAIEDALRGMRPGESREAEVAFPAEDSDTTLAGKTGRFTVTLVDCKRKQVPDLNDDFAREVSEGSTTVEELRAEVQKTLARVAASRADDAVGLAARERAVDEATVEIPPVMVERRIDASLRDLERQLERAGSSLPAYLEQQGRQLEDLRQQMRPDAERQVKTQLVLEAIAEREGLEPTADEVRREIEDMASQYGPSAGPVRRLLQRPENMADVRGDLRLAKAARFLRDLALSGGDADAPGAEGAEADPPAATTGGGRGKSRAEEPGSAKTAAGKPTRSGRSGRSGAGRSRAAAGDGEAGEDPGAEPEDRAEAKA